MSRRFYSSSFVATTTVGGLLATDTTITVAALSGAPASTPWTAVLERGTSNEDLVTVTGVSGTTLTVVRGVDGQTAKAHTSGVAFEHVVSARDFDEPNAHLNGATTHTGLTAQPTSAASQGLVVKGLASQTANLAEFQNSSGTVMALINVDGSAALGGAPVIGRLTISTNGANTVGAVIRGVASQTANLAEFQDNTGTPVTSINSQGHPVVGTSSFGIDMGLQVQPANTIGVGIGGGAAADLPLLIRGATSQSANLTSWQNVGTTNVAYVNATGNVAGTGAYTTLSDFSAKENITPLDGAAALDAVKALKPVRYDYIDGETAQRGFVAQDVQKVIPDAVTAFGDEGLLGLRDGAILSTLVAAVQQQQAQIEALTARVAALEGAR